MPYFELSFAGFDNFINTFYRPEVSLVVKNTIVWTVVFVLIRLLLGLGSALIMNANVKLVINEVILKEIKNEIVKQG